MDEIKSVLAIICVICIIINTTSFKIHANTTVSIGNVKVAHADNNGSVLLETDSEKVEITFCKNNMVRVRMGKRGQDFAPEDKYSEAISKHDYDVVNIMIEDKGEYLKVYSSELILHVYKNPISIEYYNSKEELITKKPRENAMNWDSSDSSKTVNFDVDAAGKEEHFYGLGSGGEGSSFTSINWRNQVYNTWLSDKNKHAITPLVYSTAGYGLYLHSSWESIIDFKTDPYSIEVSGGELDYYFFYGPSFKRILSDFSELSGRMAMPPEYSLGLTYRGQSNWTEQQMLDAIKAFQKEEVLIDIIGVEPGWQTGSYPCTYVWSNRFPDPKGFIDKVHDLGVKVNLWEHPYVSNKSPIYNDIKPYSIPGNKYPQPEHNGSYYGFGGLIPDFTMDEVRNIYWDIHKQNLIDIGVDGFKIDETDSWSSPQKEDLFFPGGLSFAEYHNLLGTLVTNLIHDGYKDDYNKRTFIFSRGNYTGMQKYATAAYTDYYGFDQFLSTSIAQGFSGTYFVPEVRGNHELNDILYQRRMQFMMLTPFPMINEYVEGQMPMDRSKETFENFKYYNELHYKLIPYMYSYFRVQNQTGLGVIRPLVMEYQNDENTYDIGDQYLLGENILVAPIYSTKRVVTRDIYLPEGKWVDASNGYIYSGKQTISYQFSDKTLPAFIKAGSIIPMGDYNLNTENKGDLILDIFPGSNKSEFNLYEDDGISFDYEKGAYCDTLYQVEKNNSQITVTINDRKSPEDATIEYSPAARNYILQIHYRSNPSEVMIDGAKIQSVQSLEALQNVDSGWYYDNNDNDINKIIYVKLVDDGKMKNISATVPNEPEQGKMPEPVIPSRDTYEFEDASVLKVGVGLKQISEASNGLILNYVGNDGKNY